MLTTEQLTQLNWSKSSGMMPVIVQHYISGEILMHGYMNKTALQKSLIENRITFFSRTKNRLWTKGETSGNFLNIKKIAPDCDNDTLLALVDPTGPVCHLGTFSCFNSIAPSWIFLYHLELLISKRKNYNSTNSYTSDLYSSGTKRIAQKVGEEGVETALAAVDGDHLELINEASDLVYHLLVLLQNKNIDFNTIINNLYSRHSY